jgi:hypothetical protein
MESNENNHDPTLKHNKENQVVKHFKIGPAPLPHVGSCRLFQDADILITADCAPVKYADYHRDVHLKVVTVGIKGDKILY